MLGFSFKTSLKKRAVLALLIMMGTTFLGLFIAVRLFISESPTTEFLVNNTWCSINAWEVRWMFDEDESFVQHTVIFDQYSREKVFESGSWQLTPAQNGDVKLKITWHETQSREEVEQYFNATTNGTNLLRVYGDLYGLGKEGNTIFYRCNAPR